MPLKTGFALLKALAVAKAHLIFEMEIRDMLIYACGFLPLKTEGMMVSTFLPHCGPPSMRTGQHTCHGLAHTP